MNPEIVLISHPSAIWVGARHLHVAETGQLLAISRDPIRDAASRLAQEGYDPDRTFVLKDAAGIMPDRRSSIKSALANG
jgi:hypothetical protein